MISEVQNLIGKILAGCVALIMSLLAVIYNTMAKRVERLEKKVIDEMLPAVIETRKDVKTIKENCIMCDAGNGDKEK